MKSRFSSGKNLLAIILITATTSAFSQHHEENTNMDVHMDGMGVDMNVNINVTETYSETHTTTTTTTSNSGGHANGGGNNQHVMPGYGGAIGCNWPMEDAQFADAKRSVSSKDFEDSKLTVAKQITGANCLTASQVREMMTVFDFEDSKLQYAKFAYGQTYDLGNYYKLNDAFDFESSIDELNAYINGGR
ncbi:MAG: DUF4476 domain-containing protein [Flavobacteriales bacterium]|nr:DUF4476 domain-containing protein [Flavobacteriales bacterium]